MKLAEHPTVKRIRQQETTVAKEDKQPLDADWLRQLVLDAGADDVGFVQIDRHEIGIQAGRNDNPARWVQDLDSPASVHRPASIGLFTVEPIANLTITMWPGATAGLSRSVF